MTPGRGGLFARPADTSWNLHAAAIVRSRAAGIMPADHPKYLFLVLMDEPQAIPGTYGYHTAAWNSGVVDGLIMERVAPLLGMPPMIQLPVMPFPLLARMGYGQANIPQHSKEGLH